MANSFTKQEKVMFDTLLEGFNDQLVMSALVDQFNMGDQEAERSSDVIWRPVPYIAQSFDGIDQTANFGDSVQLSVPAQIGTIKSSNFTLNAREMRDALQAQRKTDAAKQKLASDINGALMTTAANGGTQFVKRTQAASGYDDIAEADAMLNEQGIPMDSRYIALSSRDYNSMAGNLAQRQTMNDKPTRAYEKSYVGEVANFETHKLDYARRLTAAAGTTVTISAANQYYTPVATSASGNGYNRTNVDNRYQTISIAVVSGAVKVGDAFTIAGVNSVHHITKEDTGQLKTFRVTEIVTGAGGTGTVKISPPIISGGGATDAEAQYKNASATPANGAAITFLNTVTAAVNPFWRKGAIELLPSRLVIPTDAGLTSMAATTDQGVSVLMTRQGSILDLSCKYRLDVFFGTALLLPEHAGVMMFGQT